MPSPYAIEQAMSALMQAKRRLLEEDPEMARDSLLLQSMLEGDAEAGDYMAVIHNMLRATVHAQDLSAAADRRAEIMQERAQRYAIRAATIRTAAFQAMQALSLPKIELPDLTASVRKGSPSVYIIDETLVPDEYVKTTRSVMKQDIRRALQDGRTVAGATLTNGPDSLIIRTE